MKKVLLVEDDPNLGFVIKDHLEFRHYAVSLCEDGNSAWELFESSLFDICILDIMLPQKTGFDLIKLIREKDKNIPVLFISARSMNEDKIMGLKLGADDYITKPFSIEELVLRIEVFLRRSGKVETLNEIFRIGQYRFDYLNQSLEHAKSTVKLTQKEAEVLRILCSQMDNTIRREDILRLIWGDDDYFMGRSLDVYISRLRKYFVLDPQVEIANVFSVGFRLTVKGN
jgi:DNA-binding response OmpR family regulator